MTTSSLVSDRSSQTFAKNFYLTCRAGIIQISGSVDNRPATSSPTPCTTGPKDREAELQPPEVWLARTSA